MLGAVLTAFHSVCGHDMWKLGTDTFRNLLRPTKLVKKVQPQTQMILHTTFGFSLRDLKRQVYKRIDVAYYCKSQKSNQTLDKNDAMGTVTRRAGDLC